MGAVAVDGGGAVWWIDDGGRLRRRGGGVVRAGVAAVAVASSGMLVLDVDGGLRSLEAAAYAGAGDADAALALEPARDLAVDDVARLAYLAVDGAVIARSLVDGARRVVIAVEAAAMVLAPDRRRLYVADRAGRIAIVAVGAGASAVAELEAEVALDDAPTGLALSQGGLVVSTARTVIGLNLRHGGRAVLHTAAAAPALLAARGIAAARDRRMLWIADGERLIGLKTDGSGASVDAG